jgi:hypothetical protein
MRSMIYECAQYHAGVGSRQVRLLAGFARLRAPGNALPL